MASGYRPEQTGCGFRPKPAVDSARNRHLIPLRSGGGWRPGPRVADASEILLTDNNGRYRPLVFFVGAGDAHDEDDDAADTRSFAAEVRTRVERLRGGPRGRGRAVDGAGSSAADRGERDEA